MLTTCITILIFAGDIIFYVFKPFPTTEDTGTYMLICETEI